LTTSTENIVPFTNRATDRATPRATDGPSMSQVEVLTWGQLQAHEFPERKFVIDPILRDRQVAMIYAPTGVGKTWFAAAAFAFMMVFRFAALLALRCWSTCIRH
jgi:hypothetical protein